MVTDEMKYDLLERVLKIYRDARVHMDADGINETLQMEIERQGCGYAPNIRTHGWCFLTNQLKEEDVPTAANLGLIVEGRRHEFYDRFRFRYIMPIAKDDRLVTLYGIAVDFHGIVFMSLPFSSIYSKEDMSKAKLRLSYLTNFNNML